MIFGTLNLRFALIFAIYISFFTNIITIAESYPDPDEVHLNEINFCRISKKTTNDYEPVKFERSNNLLRKAGEMPMFCGERIIVFGKLLDQNCVPISDAKIYAWQVGCDGKYPYTPLKDMVNKELVKINAGLTFLGNGTATTNNKGEFHFITVYPRGVHDLGPHINVKVEHHRLGNFQTRLVLHDKKLESPSDDPELTRIAPVAYDMGSNVYDFEIVMPGESLKYY